MSTKSTLLHNNSSTSADMVALRVRIPRDLDVRLEIAIAGTGMTKREVVAVALERELARMEKRVA